MLEAKRIVNNSVETKTPSGCEVILDLTIQDTLKHIV
jgi:hypothetical protein